jgi:hypothetical protein
MDSRFRFYSENQRDDGRNHWYVLLTMDTATFTSFSLADHFFSIAGMGMIGKVSVLNLPVPVVQR